MGIRFEMAWCYFVSAAIDGQRLDGWVDGKKDGWKNGWIYMERKMDRQMIGGWIGEWMVQCLELGLMNERINAYMDWMDGMARKMER